MVKHLMSHYKEADGTIKVVSWVQINFMKWYWIFNEQTYEVEEVISCYE